jgi:hypothetical protein
MSQLKEDLAVWFGKKKKSKGSKQPQGPWVNICKKKEGGGHPPCGRDEGETKGYPVCRARSVASKMTEEEKKSACARKRAKEKKDPQSGKGQKPTRIQIKGYKKESVMNKKPIFEWKTLNENKIVLSEEMKYHINNNISIHENVFRMGSDKYFSLFREARSLGYENFTNQVDRWLIKNTDIGLFELYEGELVPLDVPMLYEAEYQGKKVQLNKPMRGGSGGKKFKVYVKDPKTGNIKKVSFGAAGGGGSLAVKLKDPAAKRSFAARHKCHTTKDKTTASYWACRLPRYAKSLGLSGGGTWW